MTSRCDIRIRAELTGYAVQLGNSVDLALVATNQSPVTEDTLVAVTSGVGEITLVGNTEIPATGILIIDSTDRARARARWQRLNPLTPLPRRRNSASQSVLAWFTTSRFGSHAPGRPRWAYRLSQPDPRGSPDPAAWPGRAAVNRRLKGSQAENRWLRRL